MKAGVFGVSAAAHAAALAGFLLVSPLLPSSDDDDVPPGPALSVRMEPLADVTVDLPDSPKAQELPFPARAEAPEIAFDRPELPAEPPEPARCPAEPHIVTTERRPFVKPSARLVNPPATTAPAAVTVISPVPRDNPKPDYPDLARKRRWEGRVEVGVDVAADGAVLRTWIVTSSGHEILDEAATNGVAAWTFEPARRDGAPVAGTVIVPVRFTLTS